MTDQTAPAPKPSAYHALKRRRQRFVDEYVATGVGAEAYRRVWPKTKRPDSAAYKLLREPDIAQAIRERTDQAIREAGVNQFRTMQELARIAYFSHKHLYDEAGQLIPTHLLPDDVAAALAQIEHEDVFEHRDGTRTVVGSLHKYRVWSKTEALTLLMKFQRMIVEKHEHTGQDGEPLAPPIINIGFANGGPGEPPASAEGS